ncbi:SRPBCC family protein [Planctomonas psychrotolerans]|uniref:SRPBCC family protein n=1 Tax=Planctomonas psychrotolerans TaxID=2528712 RepID=UPI0012391A9C|nr:SRPBCC family protein [Planctomonas psychrotolerans]
MSTRIEKTILVNVPVSRAYNQWTQFEEFPHFMNGIKKITHLGDDRLEWVAEIAGVRRKWEAKILEQVPDRKVSWAATEGATNAGEVTFEDLGGGQTSVHLSLEYEPEGLVEKVGDKLNVVENQTQGDLERFKAFIESEDYATGAWRGTIDNGGTVGTPGVEDAEASRGDSGKAGVSGKVIAAGVAAAAAAAVGVAAATKDKDSSDDSVDTTPVTTTPPIDTAPVAPGQSDEPVLDGTVVTDDAGLTGDPFVTDELNRDSGTGSRGTVDPRGGGAL